MKIKISVFLMLIGSLALQAQDFDYEIDFETVATTGYYKIGLTPEVLGKSNLNLSDLRVYNSVGVEQPFLVDQESKNATYATFKEYEIVDRVNRTSDSSSFMVFVKKRNEPINKLSFIVQNTSVSKQAVLSGSNDQNNWYVISSDNTLSGMHSSKGTTTIKNLNFPLSDYRYFKLEVENNVKEPINILKIGYHDWINTSGLSSAFDFRIDYQQDTAKTSYIRLSLAGTKYLERLSFEVEGTDFYSRRARLFTETVEENRKNEKVLVKKRIGSIVLKSTSNNVFEIAPLSVSELFIQIDNKDDQPLKLSKVRGAYLNKYLIAKLEAGESYRMKFGNESIKSPNYDLAYFRNQIPEEISTISLKQMKNLSVLENQEIGEQSLFENVYLIWSVIGVVGLLLGWMSVKMIKELGEKAKSEK